MRCNLQSACLALLGMVFLAPPLVGGEKTSREATSRETSRVTFQLAEGTQLKEILIQRRKTLEQRKGGELTGHQWWLWGLGCFDYDRDGDLDLIVCVHGSTNGAILRNELRETGKLAFTDVTRQLGVDGLVPSTDTYPTVWDFDGDGYLDIAGLLNDSPTPSLLNHSGKRLVKAPFSLHPINYPDAIRDLDGDQYVDISQTVRGRRIRFHYDPQASTFKKSATSHSVLAELPAAIQTELQAVQVEKRNRFIKFKLLHADLNGDGQADTVVRAFGSYAGDRRGWYLIADQNGALVDRTEALGLPAHGAPLLIDDLDQDGDVDLLICSGKQAGLFLNDGQGGFKRRAGPLTDFVKQRCPYLHVAKRADFDADGDLDLAVSNRRYGRQMVFENHGAGEFLPVLNVRGWDADPLVLRDIDNDGRVDVIVGGSDGKESIGVYLNTTAPLGNASRVYLRMKSPNLYAVGTRIETFRAGTLGAAESQPIRTDTAPLDGTPLHLGFGEATSFDLRVRFPGHRPVELREIEVRPELTITPAGMAKSDR